MTELWYALQSKPNQEDRLFQQLLQRDLQVFFPRLHVQPVNPRSRTFRPYFPGYLFAHLDLAITPLSSIAWVPGMNRIVSFDDQPATVPDEIVHRLEKYIEAINAAGPLPVDRLQKGDAVLVDGGLMDGYEGIFDAYLDGKERVVILISMLRHRHIRMQLPQEQVIRKKA